MGHNVEAFAPLDSELAYVRSDDIVTDACTIIDGAREFSQRAVNVALVRRNWLLGRRIAEEELGGEGRAEYGKEVVKALAQELTGRYGKGFTYSALYRYAQFYKCFPDFFATTSQKSRGLLSWSHYIALLKVTDPVARLWFEQEALSEGWSVRTHQRNFSTLYYQRLLMSQVKEPVVAEMREKAAEYERSRLEFVKNPVIAEFLGVPQDKSFAETDLEEAILSNLQTFLMELGKGYAFVARQQRIHADPDDYYVDLVFYNYILKCFVLIDLKTGKITHQDIGQMDMYVRMYDDLRRQPDDNPTLGIILCTGTNETIARYSVLHDSKQLFMARYELCPPSEEELRAEIEHQKEMFYLQRGEQEGL